MPLQLYTAAPKTIRDLFNALREGFFSGLTASDASFAATAYFEVLVYFLRRKIISLESEDILQAEIADILRIGLQPKSFSKQPVTISTADFATTLNDFLTVSRSDQVAAAVFSQLETLLPKTLDCFKDNGGRVVVFLGQFRDALAKSNSEMGERISEYAIQLASSALSQVKENDHGLSCLLILDGSFRSEVRLVVRSSLEMNIELLSNAGKRVFATAGSDPGKDDIRLFVWILEILAEVDGTSADALLQSVVGLITVRPEKISIRILLNLFRDLPGTLTSVVMDLSSLIHRLFSRRLFLTSGDVELPRQCVDFVSFVLSCNAYYKSEIFVRPILGEITSHLNEAFLSLTRQRDLTLEDVAFYSCLIDMLTRVSTQSANEFWRSVPEEHLSIAWMVALISCDDSDCPVDSKSTVKDTLKESDLLVEMRKGAHALLGNLVNVDRIAVFLGRKIVSCIEDTDALPRLAELALCALSLPPCIASCEFFQDKASWRIGLDQRICWPKEYDVCGPVECRSTLSMTAPSAFFDRDGCGTDARWAIFLSHFLNGTRTDLLSFILHDVPLTCDLLCWCSIMGVHAGLLMEIEWKRKATLAGQAVQVLKDRILAYLSALGSDRDATVSEMIRRSDILGGNATEVLFWTLRAMRPDQEELRSLYRRCGGSAGYTRQAICAATGSPDILVALLPEELRVLTSRATDALCICTMLERCTESGFQLTDPALPQIFADLFRDQLRILVAGETADSVPVILRFLRCTLPFVRDRLRSEWEIIATYLRETTEVGLIAELLYRG